MVDVVWWVDIVLLVLVSTLGVVITLVLYLIYRRRWADLDVAGAEAIGESIARPHGR